jgi:uncharacterized protein
MTQTQSNPFLLAADNSPELLPLLRRHHSLALAQDDHGYSLLHAATSYNHLDLLRSLLVEFNVPVDLKDEDGETALFVCETVECARLLVEGFHADISVKGEDGKTAWERIETEGDFPEVAAYLLSHEEIKERSENNGANGTASQANNIISQAPPLPEGLSIDIGTMAPEDVGEDVVDPEFKKRIEELAARSDFQGEEGQRQLRELITEAVRGQIVEDREVRQRTS